MKLWRPGPLVSPISILIAAAICYAQTEPVEPAPAARLPERWNLFYQATSIGQHHGTFRSAYEGSNSLGHQPESEVSLTTTLFFGFRPARNTQFYFDPEIAGGKGFSGVTGIANFPNGETPRVASATPKPYRPALCHSGFRIRAANRKGFKRGKSTRWRAAAYPLQHHAGPVYRHRLFRQQPVLTRS